MQYAMVRGLDGSMQLQHVASVGEYGLGYKLDDAYRLRVYEGFFDKNKRMGLGRETLNRGEIREGMFDRGKLDGAVRITFPPTKTRPKGSVSFATYCRNVRGNWLRSTRLLNLEDVWFEEVRVELERAAKMDKTLKMLSKYGVLKVKDALNAKEEEKKVNEAISKEEQKREEEVANMFKPKKVGEEETPAGECLFLVFVGLLFFSRDILLHHISHLSFAQHTQHTFFMEQKKGGMHWRNSFSKAHEVEMGGGLSS